MPERIPGSWAASRPTLGVGSREGRACRRSSAGWIPGCTRPGGLPPWLGSAPRAAALAEVPVSAVYDWARTGPSGHAPPTVAVDPSGHVFTSHAPRASAVSMPSTKSGSVRAVRGRTGPPRAGRPPALRAAAGARRQLMAAGTSVALDHNFPEPLLRDVAKWLLESPPTGPRTSRRTTSTSSQGPRPRLRAAPARRTSRVPDRPRARPIAPTRLPPVPPLAVVWSPPWPVRAPPASCAGSRGTAGPGCGSYPRSGSRPRSCWRR